MNAWRAAGVVAALATLLPVAPGAQAAAFQREPYLQSVTQERALLLLGLVTPCEVRVHVSEGTAGPARTFTSAQVGTWHEVALKGLRPDTRYTYVLEACGVSEAPEHFSTAPGPGTPLHFGVLGDSGTGDANQAAVIEAIRREAPPLLLTVGDNAYQSGTAEELQRNFFTPMAALLRSTPLFPTIGNHEYGTLEGQPYLDAFALPANNPRGTERYYSFDWGDVHFVSLDTSCVLGLARRQTCTTEEQQAWLRQDLAASPARWKVVLLHHPVWTSGKYGLDVRVRAAFASLFEEGGVDLVLSGHEHDYERTHPLKGSGPVPPGQSGGIPYVTVGNGGRYLRAFKGAAPAWSAARNDAEFGFLDVRIEGGTLSARMVTAAGRVADAFTLRKPEPLALTVAASRTSGPAPLEVELTATPSDDTAQVEWHLGPGDETVSGRTLTRRFEQPGPVDVTVVAHLGPERAEQVVHLEVEPSPPAVADVPAASTAPATMSAPAGCAGGCGGPALLLSALLVGTSLLWRRGGGAPRR